jgi:hypothetical protein
MRSVDVKLSALDLKQNAGLGDWNIFSERRQVHPKLRVQRWSAMNP